jgi:hypothetical protein
LKKTDLSKLRYTVVRKILNFVYENNIRKLNNSRAGSAKTKELKIGIYSFCTGTYSIME